MNHHLNADETLYPLFWNDFQKTLLAIPETKLEIAFATKGGSTFNSAIYVENISSIDLKKYAATDCNVSLLSGCSNKYLLTSMGQKTKRLATNQCIRHKNIIVFDLDFKDNITNYQSLEREVKAKEIEEFIETIQSKIASELLPIWIVNFSGNGIHIYFKLHSAIETHHSHQYKSLYRNICSHLEGVLGVHLDHSCSNPARTIRMPGSINWKNIANPIPCKLLLFNEQAFADKLIEKFAQSVEIKKSRNFKEKEQILKRLDFLKILHFFDYSKTNSITENKDNIVCSSPFSSDTTPSFNFDKDKKIFYDFSTAKGGDLFCLIASLAKLDVKNDFRKVIHYAKKIAGLLEKSHQETPGHYVLKEDGVWFYARGEDGDESKYWVCSPLSILALTRDLHGRGWGRILQIQDSEGRDKTWPMPMDMLAGDGLELRKRLLHLGLQINPSKCGRQHLIQYLSLATPKQFFRTIDQLGWVNDCFVMPDKIYVKDVNESANVVLSDSSKFAKICAHGNLEDWKVEIASYASKNPMIQLALAIAFAPPLLHLCGADNFGLHLVGPSSIGKTITLDIAGSVWGGNGAKGFKNRWRSTVNGLEALAAKHNDTLLVLDEIGEVSPKAAAAAAYMLANGAGKVRGAKDGSLAAQSEWRTVFLSAGEIDLSSHLESEGQKMRAGQEVRMISLDADRGKGFGSFDCIHSFKNSALFADHFRFACQRNYGVAIQEFLRNFMKQSDLCAQINTLKLEFKRPLQNKKYHGQFSRVLDHFALIYASGVFAIRFRLLAITSQELQESLHLLLNNWIESRGGSFFEEQMIISQVCAYLQTYGNSRFSPFEHKQMKADTQQCSGFRRQRPGEKIEWLILSEVFKREVCKGLNFRTVLKVLSEQGYLVTCGNSSHSINVRLPVLGQSRVYCVKESILSFATPCYTSATVVQQPTNPI